MRRKVCAVLCAMFLSLVFAAAFAGPAENVFLAVSTAFSPLSNGYAVIGDYRVSYATGDIYYCPDGENFFKDGIAGDGYAYDSEGCQMSTMTYMLEKYGDVDSQSRFIFDNRNDLFLYSTALLDTVGGQQGGTYTYDNERNGRVSVSSYQLKKSARMPGDAYYEFIDSMAGQISPFLSTRDKILRAAALVNDYYTYDKTARYDSLEYTVQTGRAVCFHYARCVGDILFRFGIKYDVYYGIHDDVNHLWMRAWDDGNGSWIYLDPTYGGFFDNYDRMSSYFESYVQEPVTKH